MSYHGSRFPPPPCPVRCLSALLMTAALLSVLFYFSSYYYNPSNLSEKVRRYLITV